MVLAGNPPYTVTGGEADFCGKDLLAMEPEVRVLFSWLFLESACILRKSQAYP